MDFTDIGKQLIAGDNETITTQAVKRGASKLNQDQYSRTYYHYVSRFAAHGYDGLVPGNREKLARYAAKYYLNGTTKGLALVGSCGRGKTFGLRIFSKLFGLEDRIFYARELFSQWQTLDEKSKHKLHTEVRGYLSQSKKPEYDKFRMDRIIDDLGAEPTLVEFGTRLEVLDNVMEKCHCDYENLGAFTFLTSNLTLEPIPGRNPYDSLTGRYGERFVSRLHQMCHIITLAGDDRRKS